MSEADYQQLALLAQIDEVTGRLQHWAAQSTPWLALQQTRALLKRLLQRVDPLRLRIDAPLVVATFGGTGVGKSSLVNALLGEELAVVGRQRPTTVQPTIIAHPETDLAAFGFPLSEVQVVRREAAMLRDLLIVDCPDPDTSDDAAPETNLARLQRILPFCDVLLCVSTQQKYRSARVTEELAQAAAGCKLVFVQTHADRDSDIRADWRAQLSAGYDVADLFFVDSRAALKEAQAGLRPTGETGRLLDLLFRELSAAQRVRIRRANLFGLLQSALTEQLQELRSHRPAVEALQAALEAQRTALATRLSQRLTDELAISRGLWERRVLGQVVQLWGFSPFALILRGYYGQASLLASWTLLRAQSTVQMALWGAIHGARWVSTRSQSGDGSEQVERLAALQVTDAELLEAQLVVDGYVRAARLERPPVDAARVKRSAAAAEDEFWSFARLTLDDMILATARRQCHPLVRWGYELVFAALPVYLLVRVGKNFFYDSAWLGQPLLETNFYLPAALFLGLWIVLLLALFTGRLRRGLTQSLQPFAQRLAQARLAHGLFPELEAACAAYAADVHELNDFATQVRALREQVGDASGLSVRRAP